MWLSQRLKKPESGFLSALHRFHYMHPEAVQNISGTLAHFLDLRFRSQHSTLIVLCIGTDRSTGDCLGPLVGAKLSSQVIPNVEVYGTLDEPVHAVNLQEILQKIERKYENPFILAIDACLGRSENVGYINIKNGPLRPGTGVNKNLPSVGNMHIVGIVNVGGFMEYMVLQNTRLSLVMQMAEVIQAALTKTFLEIAEPPAISIDINRKNASVGLEGE